MHKSQFSSKDFRGLSSKRSFDNQTVVSVRSNTHFYKAVKEEQSKHPYMTLPIKSLNFRVYAENKTPFAITATDNAFYQEFNTKERERLKKEKIKRFLSETRAKVNQRVGKEKGISANMLHEIEEHIKKILKMAIEFSMKTNMIKKSGTSVGHDDVEGFKTGPPTFNGTERDFKHHDTNKSTSRHKNMDLTELQSALDDGLKKDEIIKIIDKIIEERDSGNYNDHDDYHHRPDTRAHEGRHEEIKRNETPDFDYARLQANAEFFGIPPRDFNAQIPLLRILGLEKYDMNDFRNFNMVESLKFLKQLWKTLDHEKIEGLLNYGIVHEVMKVEERKAVRRFNKGIYLLTHSYRA